jgi:hypothetical protein
MAIFQGCSDVGMSRLNVAYNDFINYHQLRERLATLRQRLVQKWSTVAIECAMGAPQCAGLDGEWNHGRALICTISEDRIGAVLLHELVHSCGGSELDAESVERFCYDGYGATPPTPDDFDLFCAEPLLNGDKSVHVARIVIWDSAKGEVCARTKKQGKVAKGDRLFQSDDWKYVCG